MLIDLLFSTVRVAGVGYLAGSSPDGLVTLGGSPGTAEILVLTRPTLSLVRATLSNEVTGEWAVHGVDVSVPHMVVARDPTETYKDMIEGYVMPVAYT
jgi:hypothetical protein